MRELTFESSPRMRKINSNLNLSQLSLTPSEKRAANQSSESIVDTVFHGLRRLSNFGHSYSHTLPQASGSSRKISNESQIVDNALRARKISNDLEHQEPHVLPEHLPEAVVVTVIRGRRISKVEIPHHFSEADYPGPSSSLASQYGSGTDLDKIGNGNICPPYFELKQHNHSAHPSPVTGKHHLYTHAHDSHVGRVRNISQISIPDVVLEDDGPVIRSVSVIGNVDRERKISTPKKRVKDDDKQEIRRHSDQIVQLPEAIFDLDAKPYNRISSQVLAAFAANMGAFALGTVLAWSAPGLPSMRDTGDFPGLDAAQEAWIGSIATLGALVSCPAAGYSMVTFGRRKTMMYLTLPFVLGWVLIAFANDLPSIGTPIYTVYFGRALSGFCAGGYSVIAPVYVAETAHEKLRGALAAGFDLMISTGMMYIFLIGAFTTWQTQALACAIIPIFAHILLMVSPDSPRFLVEQGKDEEASKSIAWLYGVRSDELSVEIALLRTSVEESQAKPVNFDRVILKMSVLKPILICLAVMFFYVMSGIDGITFYAVDIYMTTKTDLDPILMANVLAIVQLIATLPAAFIVHKFSRRSLLLVSFFSMSLSLFAFGLFFQITEIDEDNSLHEKYTWLSMISLNIYIIAYSVGIGPLAMTLLGEMVPSHIKGLTSCISLMLRWGLGFAVTVKFMSLEEDIGIPWTYWVFGGICGVGVVFVYFCVPETRGKPLDEIQLGFIRKSKLKALAAQQAVLNKELELNLHI